MTKMNRQDHQTGGKEIETLLGSDHHSFTTLFTQKIEVD